MRTLIFFTLSLFILTVSTASAKEPTVPKTALVIGNSDYKLMPLANPANDASDIAAKLKSMGFEVMLAINKSKLETKALIRKFGNTLKQRRGVAVFFYAGHGLQIEGENYLVPTDFDAQASYEVIDAAVNLKSITGAMEEAANPLNIIVLDACRDNPFPRISRSSARGLARMSVPRSRNMSTLIAYSTSPGDVAADGDGRNSPYTKFLLKHMDTQGIPIEQVFKRVRRDVDDATEGKQMPWESSSLTQEFYFKPGQAQAIIPNRPSPVPPPPTPPSNTAKLTIFSNPSGSTINLLNSDVKYSRGVSLEPGDYQVAVSKEGYVTKKKWIVIDKNNVDIQITLRPDY